MATQQPIEEIQKSGNKSSDGTRRSDRVQISIPIEAIGTDNYRGRPFCHRGQTLTVSRHGAAIVLNYALATEQELTIRCVNTSKEGVARVVGLISGTGKDLIYGVAFLDDATNPWGIEFPTLTGTDDGFGRILLACRICQNNQVVHLNEVELEVFETNQSIQRFCKICSAPTSWKRAVNEGLRETHRERDIQTQKSVSSPRVAVNRRKHGRIRMDQPACIRQPGFAEEIVACENVSRGGLRLRTSKPYKPGAWIEVAFPYSAAGGNIFVSAKIIHVQGHGSFFRIGVAYLGASGKQEPDAYSGTPITDLDNR